MKISSLFSCVCGSVFKQAQQSLLQLVRLKALAVYVKVVNGVRLGLLGFFGLLACACLMVTSFILIHIAFVLLMPWEITTKFFVLLGIGVVYFALTLAAVLYGTSEKFWMRLSHADRLMKQAIEGE